MARSGVQSLLAVAAVIPFMTFASSQTSAQSFNPLEVIGGILSGRGVDTSGGMSEVRAPAAPLQNPLRLEAVPNGLSEAADNYNPRYYAGLINAAQSRWDCVTFWEKIAYLRQGVDELERQGDHELAAWTRRFVAVRSAEGCPKKLPGDISLSAGGRTASASVPQVSAGTRISGGGEHPILRTSPWLHGGGASFELWHELDPRGFALWNLARYVFYFRGSFDGASGSEIGDVALGEDSAFTYLFANPDSGSTGIYLNATGQTVRADTNLHAYDGAAGLQFDLLPEPVTSNATGAPVVTPSMDVGLRYRYLTRQDHIRQQSLTYADLTSAIDLDTQSKFLAPNFGIGLRTTSTGPSGFFAGVRGMLAPGLMWTDASASQVSHCGPCGAASPEYNVNLRRDFSETKFSVIAGASAEIGYQLSPGAKLSLTGSYEYLSSVPALDVPTTPTDQPVKRIDGSSQTWRVGVKFTTRF